jgi:uncharacterized protein DUF1638
MVLGADQPTAEERESADSAAPSRPLVRVADRTRAVAGQGRALVIGCGALARELVATTAGLADIDIACLSPDLHNRPERIPDQVRDRVREARADGYERIFVAYADCGTGGLIDPVLAEEGVERLAGAHCYEFFAGRADFAKLADEEPATFWLTDFLARNFERLVIRGLGIDRHPELEPMYFSNYRRLVYLSQTHDPELLAMARAAANRLGLAFEHRHVGLGELATSIQAFAAGAPVDLARPASESDAFPPPGPANRPESARPARPASKPVPAGAELVAFARPASSRDRATVGASSPAGASNGASSPVGASNGASNAASNPAAAGAPAERGV